MTSALGGKKVNLRYFSLPHQHCVLDRNRAKFLNKILLTSVQKFVLLIPTLFDIRFYDGIICPLTQYNLSMGIHYIAKLNSILYNTFMHLSVFFFHV